MTGRDHRHQALAAVCAERRAAGNGPVSIREHLREINATQFGSTLSPVEVDQIVAEGLRAEADAASVANALAVEAERDFPLTDVGNAERLVAAHGDELRFVPGVGWHVWDGRRFRRDVDGAVTRRMMLTVRGIYAEVQREPDLEKRKAIAKHATASEAEPRIRRAIALAETLREIIVPADDLDADPYALTVQNGTVDLRTGELLPHDKTRLCTKIAGTEYDPAAVHVTWERVLRDITGSDDEIEGFLQRAAGMTLAGESLDQKVLFAHGPGATGKTTFLRALAAALGEYATSADFETFVARRDTGGVRSDLARLAGARMVIGVEVDDGRRLAESVVKQLTGGDTITARFLYKDHFEFRPTFTLWLAANRRPAVDAADDAMWRRIVQIPFTHIIEPGRRDPHVLRTLTEDPDAKAAVLAWAVRGCVEWREAGRLVVPEPVSMYTEEYRRENDPLALWLADRTYADPAGAEPISALRTSYQDWAQENGERPVGAKKFAESMRSHGFRDGKSGSKRRWKGLALDTERHHEGHEGHHERPSGKVPYARAYGKVPERDVSSVPHVPTGPANAILGYDEEPDQ